MTNVVLLALLLVFLGHWLADFVWQPNWMGQRKSKEWWVLTQHGFRILVGSWFTGLVILMVVRHSTTVPVVTLEGVLLWALVNAVAHFVIDAVTSRITSRLWTQERVHGFFTTIGFDQFLHMTVAVATLGLIV